MNLERELRVTDLGFLRILSRGIRCVRYIIENHKKEFALGIVILTFFVAVATATIYNSMHMQSTVGVG